MKHVVLIVVGLMVPLLSGAEAGKVVFSGRVPERVDVKAENGKLLVSKNTQNLRVTIENRAPASIVRVEAP